jgi:hypothetical protein
MALSHHQTTIAIVSNVRVAAGRESVPDEKGGSLERLSGKHGFLTVLAVAGFVIPVLGYFLYVHAFGINLTYQDQWSDVQIIADSFSGHLGLGQLWALHNENRIFFPNLIVLLLSRTTRFNVLVEEYLSAVLLVLSIALVVIAHRRRVGRMQWLYYSPVAFLMVSIVQYQNTLWGFQLAWYLVLATTITALYLLDRPALTWPILVLAVASSVVGSFSSLQGLIVWPLGLILLLFRRRPRLFVVAWILSAIITTAVYFVGYTSNQSGGTDYVIHHPVTSARFYLALMGDVLGTNLPASNGTNLAVELFGLIILIASVWAIAAVCFGRMAPRGGPFAVALICFGLLFAVFVTGSRAFEGLNAAGASRYRTFDLLPVVGIYLLALEGLVNRRIAAGKPRLTYFERRTSSPTGVNDAPLWRLKQRSVSIFAVTVAAIMCLQFGVGIPEGLAGTRTFNSNQVRAARMLSDIKHYPDGYVQISLGAFQSAGFIRQMARVLEQHRLSLFATDAAARYRAEGPLAIGVPTMEIAQPLANSILKGHPYLVASVTDPYGVTKVEFEITGAGLKHSMVIHAIYTIYGWNARWNTVRVPDGPYVLNGTMFDAAGHEIHSSEVSVIVRNH